MMMRRGPGPPKMTFYQDFWSAFGATCNFFCPSTMLSRGFFYRWVGMFPPKREANNLLNNAYIFLNTSGIWMKYIECNLKIAQIWINLLQNKSFESYIAGCCKSVFLEKLSKVAIFYKNYLKRYVNIYLDQVLLQIDCCHCIF